MKIFHAMNGLCTAVLLIPALSGLSLASGCSPTQAGCVADDQCPLGEQCHDGECLGSAAHRADASLVRALDAGHGSDEPDGAVQHDAGQPGGLCPHNDDGVLTAEELPLALGVEARFIEARPDASVTVDVQGTVDAEGIVTWDYSQAMPGDAPAVIQAIALADMWFAVEFAGASYVVPLDGTAQNYGVYSRSANEVLLHGVASHEPDHTLLKYDPPVAVIRFPIALGQSFTTTTHTAGTFKGNPFYTSTDTYEMVVDARGRVITPAGVFSTLRTRVVQRVEVPVAWWPFKLEYRYVRYSYLAPCYSQVAHVASMEGEEQMTFTEASELRRLGLAQ